MHETGRTVPNQSGNASPKVSPDDTLRTSDLDGMKYENDDMSREAREWRVSVGRLCCNWHYYMLGDGCDICQPPRPTEAV